MLKKLLSVSYVSVLVFVISTPAHAEWPWQRSSRTRTAPTPAPQVDASLGPKIDQALQPFVIPSAQDHVVFGWRAKQDAQIFFQAETLDHPYVQQSLQPLPTPTSEEEAKAQRKLWRPNPRFTASDTPFTDPGRVAPNSGIVEYTIPKGTQTVDLSSPQVQSALRAIGVTSQQAAQLTSLPVVVKDASNPNETYLIKSHAGVRVQPFDTERFSFDTILSSIPNNPVAKNFFGGVLLSQIRNHPDKDYTNLVMDPKTAPFLSDDLAVSLLLDKLHKQPNNAKQLTDQFFKVNPLRNPDGAVPEAWVKAHAISQIKAATTPGEITALTRTFLLGGNVKDSYEAIKSARAGLPAATQGKLDLAQSMVLVKAAKGLNDLAPQMASELAQSTKGTGHPFQQEIDALLTKNNIPGLSGLEQITPKWLAEEREAEEKKHSGGGGWSVPLRGRGQSDDFGDEDYGNPGPAQFPTKTVVAATTNGEKVKIGIIGDSHGDLVLLEKILKRFKQEGVTHIVSIGDMMDGSEQSLRETLDLIRKTSGLGKDRLLLMPGNWEHEIALGPNWTMSKANRVQQEYGTLINDHFFGQSIVQIGGKKLMVSHYPVTKISPKNLKWPLRRDTQEAYDRDVVPPADVDLVLFGHTHAPNLHFDERTGRYFLNIGTLGDMKDLNETAGYALYDGTSGQLSYYDAVTHKPFAQVKADRTTASNRPTITPFVCNLSGLATP